MTKKPKNKTIPVGDTRLWAETTTTKDMPPGPSGQPGHPKGSIVRLNAQIATDSGDRLGFAFPRGSEMLFKKSEELILEAEQLKKKVFKSITAKGYIKPYLHGSIGDEQALYAFLENSFLGLLGLLASLEALASEIMFKTETLKIKGETLTRSTLLNRGPEYKLTVMASAVTKKKNIYGSNLHEKLKILIEQRRKIQHWNIKRNEGNFSELEHDHPISFVINNDLLKYLDATRSILDHYKF